MQDQYFYGHGKLLLTGEYFVLDGARALALPTSVGQSMRVKYRNSYQPTLNWKSFDHTGNLWFESDFEFWHFEPIRKQNNQTQSLLQQVLKSARSQNPHFLRDDMDVFVETKIEFPLEWGLGSSSTFIYNVAQWAYVSPFELLKKTIGGSGYDIACAQAGGPIQFRLNEGKPQWEAVDFLPPFLEQLYFIYLGKKQSSREEIFRYKNIEIENKSTVSGEISQITMDILSARSLSKFEELISKHEELISQALKLEKIKDLYFSDFWGQVKSLGAWGGDFALVTSDRSPADTRDYFLQNGVSTFIPYSELVRNPKMT